MADGGAEAEGLDVALAEEGDLVVPVGDGSGPVGLGTQLSLLVDVQVLSHAETTY